MARDPDGIALQSVDPDLASEGDDLTDGGAGDLMDYGSSVLQWGVDSTTALIEGGGSASQGSPTTQSEPCKPAPFFHASTRITTPFTVAAVVAVLIVVIVFIPKGA